MSRRERLALAVIVGLLALLAGALDQGDPTPAVIRWPIAVGACGMLAWVVWRASGRG